ncbi:glycosyltransferase family 2 protein [Rhizorhapis sp. SPR117]|uniref:glycosyltransferase family 2 protein n=1 Tax=Rhizorhapis sp. SPR117 TaxID=2912611 RepID=UPI001F1C297E|nr:glycosyltransferase [Rhizorhapis sp. SPR117]
MSAVSVVVPARNAEATLAVTLDSLLAQRWDDWHVIIVNDGSTDATAGIASDYCDRDARFQLVETAGAGVAAARNEGLRHAQGRALLFLDADDWIAPDHLARLSEKLRSDPGAGASYCGYVRVTPEGQAFMPRFSPEIAADARRVFGRSNPLATPHTVMLARDKVENLGGFDTCFQTCEDWDLWQRLAFSGARFLPVEDVHARYCLRRGSASQDMGQLFRDAATLLDKGAAGQSNGHGEQELSLAWFGLWCAALSAGQDRPLPNWLPELPAVSVPASEARMTASLLMEALCTGACCTPAHLTSSWAETKERLRIILDEHIEPDAHGIVFDSFADMLGVAPLNPMELVSVVIPAYKATETIGETLQSVQTQTHAPLDIIVVDDGSPDDTQAMILSFAASDPRISLMQQANAGVAAARNRGWKVAASDLIAFVDADDLWAPSKIERQLAALKAEGPGTGLAYTWYARIDEDSLITSRSHRPIVQGDVLKAMFLGNFIGNGSAALMIRAALEEAGGFDSSLHARGAQGCEDFSIYFRIAEKYRFALVPEPLTGYRVLPGNMSSDMLRMLRSFDLVAAEMLSRHPAHHRDIMAGRAYFLEWSILTAAERGAFRTGVRLFLAYFRQKPVNSSMLLAWKLPRAIIRGLRLRVAGKPRRRRDYAPSRFLIGCYDGAAMGETSHG